MDPATGDQVVRVKVSTAGKFTKEGGGAWRYVGGHTFLESVPRRWRYADLMFSLAEKVDGAVSVKYQLPGEELDPDSLISVADDGDIEELFDEYVRALCLPGTPVKTFRLRMFLFPASEDPYTPEDMAQAASHERFLGSQASSGAGAARAALLRDALREGGSLAKAFSRASGATPAAAPAPQSVALCSGINTRAGAGMAQQTIVLQL